MYLVVFLLSEQLSRNSESAGCSSSAEVDVIQSSEENPANLRTRRLHSSAFVPFQHVRPKAKYVVPPQAVLPSSTPTLANALSVRRQLISGVPGGLFNVSGFPTITTSSEQDIADAFASAVGLNLLASPRTLDHSSSMPPSPNLPRQQS